MTVNFALLSKVVLALVVVGSLISVSVIDQSDSDKQKFTCGTDGRHFTPMEQLMRGLFPFDEPANPEEWKDRAICGNWYEGASAAHTFTDKPVYRPGDMMFIRSVYLDSTYLRAATSSQDGNWFWGGDSIDFVVENVDTENKICEGKAEVTANSVAYAQCEIPQGTTGGLYTIKVNSWSFPMSERTVEIRDYVRPELNVSVDLDKQTLVAGDSVKVTVAAKKMNGATIHGAKVTLQLMIDGAEDRRYTGTINSSNLSEFLVTLPTPILSSASVAARVEASGVYEVESKTLPVVLDTIKVKYYPEGGSLLAGVENHVYFESFVTFDQPAEWKAQVVGRPAEVYAFLADAEQSSQVPVVDEVIASHEGRGVFKFTPKVGMIYSLQFTVPSGVVSQGTDMPMASNLNAWMLHAEYDLDTDNIEIKYATFEQQNVVLYLKRGGDLKFAEKTLTSSGATAQSVSFDNISSQVPTGGVITITMYHKTDDRLLPLAERLVFVQPSKVIKTAIETDQPTYEPGTTVRGSVRTYYVNENSQEVNVSSRVSVTVTDESSRISVDSRRLPPNLPTSVLLEDEIVRDMRDSDSYLNGFYTGEKVNVSEYGSKIDLLLGVQGWRRFIFWDFGQTARKTYADNDKVLRKINRVLKQRYDQDDIYFDDFAEAIPLMDQVAEGAPEPQVVVGMPEPDFDVQNGVADAAQPNFSFKVVDADYVETYAHELRENYNPSERIDFTETLYWNAGALTDAEGRYNFEFKMNDSITTFAVIADAFTNDGFFGAALSTFTSDASFYVDMRVPSSVTVGDKLSIPVTVTNNKDKEMEVTLLLQNTSSLQSVLSLSTANPIKFTAAANETTKKLLEFTILDQNQSIPLTINASAIFDGESHQALITKQTSSYFAGIPLQATFGSKIGPSTPVSHSFTLPDSYVDKSVTVRAKVYPTPFSNMSESLASLIREPYGCFEQTSSTTFPLVMALRYFKLHNDGSDRVKELIADSLAKLQNGYEKLITFQTTSGGFEWFGSDPAHEALTAYGILQFTQMKEVMGIDSNVLSRATQWLNGRRNNDGGYTLSDRVLDSFGSSPQDVTDAYIVWALSSAGITNLSQQIESLITRAASNNDPYFTALVAISCYNLNKADSGKQLAQKLVSSQQVNGSVTGAQTSITRSYGEYLDIETTALSVLAWMKDDDTFGANASKAMNYIVASVKDGAYGTTQSTILSLMAIVEYEVNSDKLGGSGEFVLSANGTEVGRLPFTKTAQESLNFDDLAAEAFETLRDNYSAGSVVNLSLSVDKYTPENASGDAGSTDFAIPYSMSVFYKDLSPDTNTSPLTLDLSINGSAVVAGSSYSFTEGEVLPYTVKVTHNGSENAGMIVAVVGLPGNCEPVFSDLRSLKEAGTIDYYETKEREVILYWRTMDANTSQSVNFNVKTITPGTYSAAASRVYTYYGTMEQWIAPYSVSSVASTA